MHPDISKTSWQSDLRYEAERVARKLPEELRKIFVNCYLCTAETTVLSAPEPDMTAGKVAGTDQSDDRCGGMFLVTGDIPAMWLRDSAAQVRHYLPMAAKSEGVYHFISAVLEREFQYIQMDAYANAFNMGPTGQHYCSSDVSRPYFPAEGCDTAEGSTAVADWEWERKFETDSLCYPVDLAFRLWKASGRTEHLTETVHQGLQRITEVFRTEQHHEKHSSYRFERPGGDMLDTLPRDGKGAPVGYTGMTWSGFRPSDDACVYGYNIPANMFAAVSMTETTQMAKEVFHDEVLAKTALALASEIRKGIEAYGIVEHPVYGRIYAYETDGMGHHLLMDDAGIPGLLSMPYYDYCPADDPVYRNTRKFSLSPENPYYYEGTVLRGLGSPHTRRDGYVWPMGVIAAGLTTLPAPRTGSTIPSYDKFGRAADAALPNPDIIAALPGSDADAASPDLSENVRFAKQCARLRGLSPKDVCRFQRQHPGMDEDPWMYVYAVASSDAGTGHIHESVNMNNASDYTRSWFAWGESLFAQLVMRAAGEWDG